MILFILTRKKTNIFTSGLIKGEIAWIPGDKKLVSKLIQYTPYADYTNLDKIKVNIPAVNTFITIKEFLEKNSYVEKKERDDFIKRLLNLTKSRQMWVHPISNLWGDNDRKG